MEKPMLTREQIEVAKKDTNHPVVKVFLNMQEEIKEFMWDYRKIKDNQEAQKYVTNNINPFAKKLNQLEEFSLEPLDIVSIWSRINQDFEGKIYVGYNLAATIPATYGTRGITSQSWKEVVPFVAKNKKIPEEILKDKQNQIYFWKRIKNVKENVKELDYFLFGTRERNFELFNKAYKEGDKEAEKKIEEMIAWEEEHKDEILGKIHENFGNGFSLLFLKMPDHIKKEVFS